MGRIDFVLVLAPMMTILLLLQRFSCQAFRTSSYSSSLSTRHTSRRQFQQLCAVPPWKVGAAAAAVAESSSSWSDAARSIGTQAGAAAASTKKEAQLKAPPKAISRPTFRMPSDAANDSQTTTTTTSATKSSSSSSSSSSSPSSWQALGLWNELTDLLTGEMQLMAPTAVQSLVLPELLQEKSSHHVAFLAATGSGTLYYDMMYTLLLLAGLLHLFCLLACFLRRKRG
jgi:hypothetical protein